MLTIGALHHGGMRTNTVVVLLLRGNDVIYVYMPDNRFCFYAHLFARRQLSPEYDATNQVCIQAVFTCEWGRNSGQQLT